MAPNPNLDNWTALHPDFAENHSFFTNLTYQEVWEKYGFTVEEAGNWIRFGLNPEDGYHIKEWEKQGFTYEEIKQWIKAGFKPYEIYEHTSSECAKKWKDLGFTAWEAREWIQAGWSSKTDLLSKLPRDCRKDGRNIKSWKNNGFNVQEAEKWIKVGFKAGEPWSARNWKDLGFEPQEAKWWINFRLDGKNALQWKSKKFSPQKAEKWIKVGLKEEEADFAIYLENRGDTSSSVNLEKLRNESWLNWQYPQEKRKSITALDVSKKGLIGSVNLTDFANLEELDCGDNEISALDVSNCKKLKKLWCFGNQLTNNSLLLPQEGKELIELKAWRNQFKDLSTVEQLINLEVLKLDDNPLDGSLNFLKNCKKLRILWINDTGLNTGLEHLPDSLERFVFQNTKFTTDLKEYNGDWKLWKKDQQIALLQREKALFTEKEQEITYLETRIQELTNLIKEQKEKIVQDFLNLFPEEEKAVLQELIIVHLKFTKAKKQGLPFIKLRQQRDKIRDELEERLKDKLVEKLELILDDCETLVNSEIELEERLNNKTLLIDAHKHNSLFQIAGSREQKLVKEEEKINQQQKQELEILKRDKLTLQLELAKSHGQVIAYKEVAMATSQDLISNLWQKLNHSELTKEAKEQSLEQINNLLAIKRMFLNNRTSVIKSLQNCCDLLEAANINKYAQREEVAKSISAAGKLVSRWTVVNVVEPVGEGLGVANLRQKRKFALKSSDIFQSLLTAEEQNLVLFKQTYQQLIAALPNLEQKAEPNLFNIHYHLYDVATNIWQGKAHLETGDMKDAISALTLNKQSLEDELQQQEKSLAKFQSEQAQALVVIL